MAGRICPECDTHGDSDVCPRCGTRMLFDTPSEPGFDPLLGKVFDGRYRLEAQLGRGGMGVVYRAVQIAMGKVVAVKVLRGELATHREAARRFHREAKAASLLSHPHTVRVFDFGQTRERELFMVMEYLEGRTLGSVLGELRRLPVDRAAAIIGEVAEALLEAHGKGLVHRDLKPDNVILLDLPGHPDFVKVLDFGIAKLLTDSGQGSDVTRTGAVVGTPSYMAPEQIQGSRAISPAQDIYALGVVLYEALAGVPPFRGDTPLEVVLAHVNQPAPELPDDVDAPGDVRALLRAMLAKDPVERPAAREVFDTLTAVRLRALTRRLANEPAADAPPPESPPLGSPDGPIGIDTARTILLDQLTPAPPPRRRWPWLAIGLGSFALAALLLVLTRPPAPQHPTRAHPAATSPAAAPPTPAVEAPSPAGASPDTVGPEPRRPEPDVQDGPAADVDSGEVVPARQGLDGTLEKRERLDATSKEARPAVRRAPPRGQVPTARPPEPEPSKPKYEPVW